MFNWFDLMRQAQGGAGLDNIARQFGLQPQQAQLAMTALMPALAMGLQHSAMNPAAAMQFFNLMSGGHYPNFFDSATQAFSTQARSEGKAVLDKLFGSDDVTRRVADQAARYSGVGTEVMNQILPLMAAIFAGGVYKVILSQNAMLGSIAQTWSAGGQDKPAPSANAGANAWIDLWADWVRAATRGLDGSGQSQPLDEAIGQLAGGTAPGADDEPKAAGAAPSVPEKEEPKAEQSEAPGFENWEEMMEKGQEMQRQHLKSLQAIFESAWGTGGPAKG